MDDFVVNYTNRNIYTDGDSLMRENNEITALYEKLINIIKNGSGTQAATFDPETMREELKKENIMVHLYLG